MADQKIANEKLTPQGWHIHKSMKKRTVYTIAGLFALSGLLSGCEDETDNVSQVVDVTYPTIELNGEPYVSIIVGTSYSDPGAVLTDSLAGTVTELTPDVQGLDVNTPGLYLIPFSARNQYGFETIVQRAVAVVPPEVAAIDLSGQYVRSLNGVVVNVTRLGDGLYQMDNVGGVPPPSTAIYPVVFVQTSPTTISVPQQEVAGAGTFDCTQETLLENGFSWVVINPGFGTGVRTFVKQ